MKHTNKRGKVLAFQPVRTIDGTICSICGDEISRAVRISINSSTVAFFFCRPCVRKAARTADFRPIATYSTDLVGSLAQYADKEGNTQS